MFAAGILGKRNISRIALVTEAHHMRRSEACFRRQPVRVAPEPCAFRTERFDTIHEAVLPGAAAIKTNEEVLHEWLGMLWYWLRGWA